MDMNVNSDRVRTLRLARGWSQEQLAAVSGLGLRTVQRIEKDGVCSLESRNSLASAFDIKSEDLQDARAKVAELGVALRILNFGRYFLIACFCLGLLHLSISFLLGHLLLDRFVGSVSVLFAVSGAVYTICYGLGEKLKFEMSEGVSD